MPVSRTEKATTWRARLSDSLSSAPAARHRPHRQLDGAGVGELEGVGEQVLEDLHQAGRVGGDRARQALGQLDGKLQVLLVGKLAERPLDLVLDLAERDLADVDRGGAGLDLGEVQDVVDEGQQVFARSPDRPGELDLLLGEVCRPGCRQAAGRGSAGC